MSTLLDSFPAGKLSYDMRLWEAEVAADMGIPFDEEWYSIELEVREQMVARKMARDLINALVAREMENARS